MKTPQLMNTIFKNNNSQGSIIPHDLTGDGTIDGITPLLFLDANRGLGLADNADIPSWTDSSGNAIEFVQGTGALQPQYKATSAINNKPGVLFTGINSEFLKVASAAALTGTAGTVISLHRHVSVATGSDQVLLASSDEASGSRYLEIKASYNSRATLMQNNAATDKIIYATAPVMVANTNYVTTRISNGSAYRIRVNGLEKQLTIQQGTNNGDWWDDATARDNIVLGAKQDSSGVADYFWGTLRYLLVYPSVLTDLQLLRIELAMMQDAGI